MTQHDEWWAAVGLEDSHLWHLATADGIRCGIEVPPDFVVKTMHTHRRPDDAALCVWCQLPEAATVRRTCESWVSEHVTHDRNDHAEVLEALGYLLVQLLPVIAPERVRFPDLGSWFGLP